MVTPVGSPFCITPGQELQNSCCALDDDFDDLNWEAEKELELLSCDGEDFVPPKIMLISSKVPKAEYIPTIVRRNDPSVIPILYVSITSFGYESPGEGDMAKMKERVERIALFLQELAWDHEHAAFDDILGLLLRMRNVEGYARGCLLEMNDIGDERAT
eukprot:g41932.t1